MRVLSAIAVIAAALVASTEAKLNDPALGANEVGELGSIHCDLCKDVIGYVEGPLLSKGCSAGSTGM